MDQGRDQVWRGHLYGKAGSAAELNLASKLANDVDDVKEVNNRMTIE